MKAVHNAYTDSGNAWYTYYLATIATSCYASPHSLSYMCCITYLFFAVVTSPIISQHPMSVTVNLTNNDIINVTLTCKANRTLCYYWERQNDIILSNATGVNITTIVNSTTGQNVTTLTLIGVQPEDTDNYQCVAINENGHTKSDNATVTINGMILSVTLRGNSKAVLKANICDVE